MRTEYFRVLASCLFVTVLAAAVGGMPTGPAETTPVDPAKPLWIELPH